MASRSKKGNSLMVEAPDKGWSWVVAVSCSLINMLYFGTSRTSSLLYVAMINRLNVSRKEASLPPSLAISLRCFCGPLAGFLADRFGVRVITLIGGTLAAFGFAMCFFTQRIVLITIFWGVLFGVGFGMGNTLLPITINEYFDKYRATANGIAFSGGCVGSFVLPSLVDFCLREYDLTGTFLILSGVLLNCVPLALFLRKPSFLSKYAVPKRTSTRFIDTSTCEKNCNRNGDTSCGKVNIGAPNVIPGENRKEINLSDLTTNIKVEVLETTQLPWLAEQEFAREKFESITLHEVNPKSCRTLEDDRIFTIDGNIQISTITNEKSQNVDLNDVLQTNAFNSEIRNERNSFRKNMTLFRNPMFILIGMSTGLYGYTFVSTITILADFAVDVGVEMSKLPYILMSLSVGDFLGRISLGSLIDKGFMTVMQYTASFFLLQALFIASFAWTTGFQYLVATSFAYGVCEAAIMLSSPLLIAKCIETKLQTVAMPSVHVFSGFMYLTIPKLIGLFREQIGSYVGLFYTMSAISLICAVTWFLVPFWMKRRSHATI